MKIINWMFAAILICGTAAFTACTNEDNPTDVETGASKLVMITKHGYVDYWKQVETAFRNICKEKDMEALYYTTEDNNAYEEQIAAIQDLKKRNDTKLRGIIYSPSYGENGESADAEVYAFAKDRGIPVIIIDSEVAATSPLADRPYFGTDNTAAGKALAAEVSADKVAAFALNVGPGLERAEAFKSLKPATTIYEASGNDNANVEAVIDEYDDFVFFNGSILNNVLPLLKAKEKNVYTFDLYSSFLDELIAGSAFFKGVMNQSNFLMTRKAVEAALANAQQGEMVPTFFITKDNLNDPAVKPYIEFFNKDVVIVH
jgi:ABC-type sugar transport system substrate-binding protein